LHLGIAIRTSIRKNKFRKIAFQRIPREQYSDFISAKIAKTTYI